MNNTQLEASFLSISKFLASYKHIWENEVIESYPFLESIIPENWLTSFAKLSKDQIYKIDTNQSYDELDCPDLISVFEKINKLKKTIALKKIEPAKLPHWAMVKIKGKKQHEITLLTSYIKHINSQTPIKKIVDIGGGKGHLSRILSHYHSYPCLSIDQDKKLQDLGILRSKKFPLPSNAGKLEFIHHDFGSDPQKERSLTQNCFVLGLHTCGALAVKHLNTLLSDNSQAILNFGCCYGKLKDENDYNLSKLAGLGGLKLTKYALTLATRSHREKDEVSFKLKFDLKLFRYCFHMLLNEHFNIKDFVGIGETKNLIGKYDFASFALEKLDFLKIKHLLSKEELNSFYSQSKPKAQQYIYADIIRWKFGRLIEYYILLDRCLYLSEQRKRVEIHQIFDESLSPRNIGIYAY